MSVLIGSGLSIGGSARDAAVSAAVEARAGLDGETADLAVVFVTGDHLDAPATVLEGVREGLSPATLIGCGAAGVLGGRREIESGTAVSVWAAAFDGGTATAFHADAQEGPEGIVVSGLPDLQGAAGAILLPDPWTFPTDAVLRDLAARAPGVPVIGGLASAEGPDGGGLLLLDDLVLGGGAVGVRLDGVEVLPCVSQGASPLGPELTITAAEGQVIEELAGQPALAKLREVIGDLDPSER